MLQAIVVFRVHRENVVRAQIHHHEFPVLEPAGSVRASGQFDAANFDRYFNENVGLVFFSDRGRISGIVDKRRKKSPAARAAGRSAASAAGRAVRVQPKKNARK